MKTPAGMLLVAVTIMAAPTMGSIIDQFFEEAFDQLRPVLKDIYYESIAVPHLTINNLLIQGLDKFYTVALSASVLPLKMNNLTILIDEIRAEALYGMEFMTLPGSIVISGNGRLDVNVTGVRLYTQSTLGTRRRKIYVKDVLECEVSVKTLDVSITGLEDGGPVGELISNIINKVARRIFNLMAADAVLENKAMLIPLINKVLMSIDVRK